MMNINKDYKRLKQWNYFAAQNIKKIKPRGIVSNLEVVEVVLVQYYLGDNHYQQKS